MGQKEKNGDGKRAQRERGKGDLHEMGSTCVVSNSCVQQHRAKITHACHLKYKGRGKGEGGRQGGKEGQLSPPLLPFLSLLLSLIHNQCLSKGLRRSQSRTRSRRATGGGKTQLLLRPHIVFKKPPRGIVTKMSQKMADIFWRRDEAGILPRTALLPRWLWGQCHPGTRMSYASTAQWRTCHRVHPVPFRVCVCRVCMFPRATERKEEKIVFE